MTDKIDPFDVVALERSLNDSAARVSTIWVSYLGFAVYLIISTGTATDRQLFFEEPFKLPALNIELPLYWFFVLTPILFVLFHFYVLLQVLLLGRTAAAYNDTLDQAVKSPMQNALMRQRLSNTLFAQIYAGSPREREGWLGWLIRAMTWITLVAIPIYVVFAFQFTFLAYHSHFATWIHRGLVFVELASAYFLFPIVLDARRDFNFSERIGLSVPVQGARPKFELRGFARFSGLLMALYALVIVLISIGSFPGEPAANILADRSLYAVVCNEGIKYDRITLQARDWDAKFTGTAQDGAKATTQILVGRDLNCSSLVGANLRGADLSAAQLRRANLRDAKLQNANLSGANLRQASLYSSSLVGAILFNANLSGVTGGNADFRGAQLNGSRLRNSFFESANFNGSRLSEVDLNGADLTSASFVGADMYAVSLRGADLQRTNLDAATLLGASLEGVDLNKTSLRGTLIQNARLQGADLHDIDLRLALVDNVNLWRALGASCQMARVLKPNFDGTIAKFDKDQSSEPGFEPITVEAVERFIDDAIGGSSRSADARERLKRGLATEVAESEMAAALNGWKACAETSSHVSQTDYLQQLAGLHVTTLCQLQGTDAIEGALSRWDDEYFADDGHTEYYRPLARGLLGLDGHDCPATKDLLDATRVKLSKIANQPDTR